MTIIRLLRPSLLPFLVVISVLSGMLAPITPVTGQGPIPSLPHAFYGTVSYASGATPAPAGTVIVARIAGIDVASFTTTAVGVYGGTSPGQTRLIIQGAFADGTLIQFYVGGNLADQTSTFQSGAVTQLNLTVSVVLSYPPSVSTTAGTGVTSTTATLNGNLSSLGTATTVDVQFEYGTTTAYGSTTTLTSRGATGIFSGPITGLTSGTLYHFRALATGAYGSAAGNDTTFTTLTSPPVIDSAPSSNFATPGTTTATLSASLLSKGTASSVSVYFEYGPTMAYGTTTAVQSVSATGAFTQAITGLLPGTGYHFHAIASSPYGTSIGPNASFVTGTTPPTVTTSAATNVAATTVTLNGNVTSLGTASSLNVSFEYGTTAAYGSNTPTRAATATGAYSIDISGLAAATAYHFRAKVDGGASGQATGSDLTFTTGTTPATVTTGTSSVTATGATLNGTLSSLGTATSVAVSFEYGLTAGYGSTATATTSPMSSTGSFTTTLSGLAAATTYHFRAKADGGAHGAATGADGTFTTGTTPPTVVTSAASALTTTTATLNGDLTSKGTAATVNARFEYGLTTSYGTQTAIQPLGATGVFTAGITGLSAGTTYHFRASADGGTSGIAYSADGTFTTSSTPPTAATNAASGVTTTTAVLNGNLSSLGTALSANAFFEYGTTTSYGSTTTAQSRISTGAFSATVTGLLPGTTYHFRARADGGAHGAGNGADLTFTTGAALTSIAILPAAPSVAAGLTQQFTATGTYSDLSTSDITGSVTWSSASTGIASINSSGLATGRAVGSSNITATLGTVTSPPAALGVTAAQLVSMTLSPLNPTIALGANQQFRTTGTFSDGSKADVTIQTPSGTATTWGTGTPATAIAALDGTKGKFTSQAAGTTLITATIGAVSASTTLTVTTATLTSITVSPLTSSVAAGRTRQYSATGVYSDSRTTDLTSLATWASNNTAVATISGNGLATTHAAGTAGITATYNSILSSTASLTVTAAVLDSVAVTPASATVTFVAGAGSTIAFRATAINSDGSTTDVTTSAAWLPSDPSKASIAASGVATTLTSGTTTITATSGGVSGSTTLTILPDTTAPAVTLINPTDGLQIRDTSLAVSGNVNDPNATAAVSVNGAAAVALTLSSAGNFNQNVTLVPGSNNVVVTATDGAGNTGTSGTAIVVVDPNRPTVLATSPRDGLLTNSALLMVSGTVTYAGTASLTLNGATPAAIGLTGGAFNTPVTLADGVNTIAITAYTTGHQGESAFFGSSGTRRVTLDRVAPVIAIDTPVSGTILSTRALTVSGRVNDPGVRNATLTFNGSSMSIPVVSGAFSQQVTLVEGSNNTITVVATDPAGNTSAAQNPPVTVTLNTRAPRVTVASPTNNILTNIRAQTVSGTISDTTITSAQLSLSGGALQTIAVAPDGSFSTSVTLEPGANTIEVTASDNATPANTGTSGPIAITVDTTAPTIDLALTDPAASITITATSSETLASAPSVVINGTTSVVMAPTGVNEWKGTYGSTASPIAVGSYTVAATGIDRAGNAGSKSGSFNKSTVSTNGVNATPVTTQNATLQVQTTVPVADATMTVTATTTNTTGGSPTGAGTSVGAFVEIVAPPGIRDNLREIYITVNYDPATVPDDVEPNLKLYIWRTDLAAWWEVPGSGVNMVEFFIFGTIDHLSQFGAFGAATVGGGGGGGGGGSGGGGGGGGAVITLSTVSLSGLRNTGTGTVQIDSSALAQANYQLKSTDDKLTLDIARNTRLLTASSAKLDSITVSKATSPARANDGEMAITAYNLGPDGSNFDPGVRLTIAYDPAALPAEVSADSLHISYWDGSRWVALVSTPGAEAASVSASIAHFTQFAVVGSVAQLPTAADWNVLTAADMARRLEALSAGQAGATLVLAPDSQKAADALQAMDTAKAAAAIASIDASKAGEIIGKVSAPRTAAILDAAPVGSAVAIMEKTPTDKLAAAIPLMQQQSLMSKLPYLSPAKLHDITAKVLFDALPGAPTENLVGETSPEPPKELSGPAVIYTTDTGARYMSTRSIAGEWVQLVGTPKPLKSVLIKTSEALANINTYVDILSGKPVSITTDLPAGQLASNYFNVRLDSVAPTSVVLGYISFQVDKAWLTQNNIARWSVTLNRYDEAARKWTALPTKIIDEDSTYLYLSAPVPGFSTFAISGSQAVAAPSFKATQLQISPTSVATGQTATVKATISNVSATDGAFLAVLWLNGVAAQAQSLDIKAGQSAVAEFKAVSGPSGEVQVRVDRQIGTFTMGLPRVSEALQSIASKYATVWGFDAPTQTWKVFDPSVPSFVNDLQYIEKAKGYYMKVNEDCTLTYGQNSYPLMKGWNLIGWLG